jgi:hypothetical protein
MHQMRDAVDSVMMDKTMFHQIATAFSSSTGTHIIDHPRLMGVRFTPETASQVRRFIEVLDEVKKPQSDFWKNFDAGLAVWKKGVTYFSPAHHIRNLSGDVSFSYLAGVNNPNVYRKAITVLRSHKDLYTGWENIDEKIAPGGVARALGRESKTPIIKARWKGGTRGLDPSQVHQIMYDRGLLPHAGIVEDIPGEAQTGNAVKKAINRIPKPIREPLGGRGKKVAQGTSAVREHYVRTAHFLDAIGKAQKHGATSIEQAIEYATKEVRKYHPDGLDLTAFEHTWMRRVFPFYSWTRKAIPLIVEGAVKKPAKMLLPNKVIYNLQSSMGLNPDSLSEPFPVGGQFPDWIRELPWGPTAGAGRFVVGNNLNPWTSTGAQLLNSPRQGAMSMLNPIARIPAEIGTGTDSQTGQSFGPGKGTPIDKTEYIDKQIPLIAYPNSLLGGNFGAGTVEALLTGNKSAMFNHKKTLGTEGTAARKTALMNFLLGAGIIDTQSPSNLKSAEFDQKARASAASKAARLKLPASQQ